MITLRRGPRPDHAAPPSSSLLLTAPGVPAPAFPHAQPPWGAFRGFLAQLRAPLGDARIAAALEPHRPLLCLALRRLPPPPASLGALALSSLPNVALRASPLYGAWRDAFAALLAGQQLTVFVPEVDGIDLESLLCLRHLLSALRDRAQIDVVLGHDPSIAPSDPLEALVRGQRLAQVALYEALPGTRVEAVDGTSAAAPPLSSLPADPLDDTLEARALRALAGRAADAPSLVRAALRASFDAFGFDATVRFSRALESAGVADDESRALGALALHNLAPVSKDPWVGDALTATFAALAASAREPLDRAHWGYRLTLAHGRTRGALEAALEAADGAVAAADEAPRSPRASFVSAWTRNSRAYVRTRLGDFEGAAQDTEDGVALLTSEPDLLTTELPAPEVRTARILLSNNRTRVAQAAGDAEGLAIWRAKTSAFVEATPVAERPGQQWFLPPDDDRDLAASVAGFEILLAQARGALDPETEAVAAHGLGLVLYKLGDARAAHEAFATSLRIWRITRGFPEDLLTEELNCAVTAFRDGDLGQAEEGFARVRANPLMEDAGPQAETLAALAMVAAKAGDAARAQSRADEASNAAAALDEPDVLLRVLRSAAEARLLLGDRPGARRTIEQAQQAMNALEESGGEALAEDVLGVLVTLLDSGITPDPALARRAAALVPAALGDANAWWDVPRLAPYVEPHRGEAELQAAFAAIDNAVAQRDWAANRARSMPARVVFAQPTHGESLGPEAALPTSVRGR